MTYLWDTNIASVAMQEEPGIAEHLEALADTDDVAVSSVTRGEILFGIARLQDSRRRSDLAAKADRLLSQVICLPVNEAAADAYAEMKAALEKAGRPIGKENDLWIAAVARAHGCVLVSAQQSFTYLSGIKVEDWTT